MSFREVRTVIYHRPRFRAWGPSFKAGDFASSTLTRTHESTSSGLLESLHYRYTAATSNGQGIRVSQAGSVHNCTALVLYCRHNSHTQKSESSVRERWEPAWGGSGQSTATTSCSATLEGPRSYRILCEKLDLMLDPARCTIAQPLSCTSCTIPLHT